MGVDRGLKNLGMLVPAPWGWGMADPLETCLPHVWYPINLFAVDQAVLAQVGVPNFFRDAGTPPLCSGGMVAL